MGNSSSNAVCVALAVDDEKAVLHLVTTMFTRAGFQVVGAVNADEALRVLSNRPDVAVLFTDCDMPKMRGPELAAIVSERWPHVRIMLTSGKPFGQDDLPEGAEFVSKPFRPSKLVPRLKEIADALCIKRGGFPEQDCA
jgi:CheY-like chemotaxis protein